MKNLRITVNGTLYDVQVEEIGESASPTAYSAASAPAPAPAPAAPAAPKPAAAGKAGSVKVTAPMPGTVLSVLVSAGQNVKKGDPVVILESMKMENEIPAPDDGVVASIEVDKGASVETGATLVTLA